MGTDKSKKEFLKEVFNLNKKIQQLETDLSNIREKADISNRLKSMFLANISHEIRTPMNGIIGMYNVLKQTELTDVQREYLNIINLSGNNLLTIIDDILDLAKIESNQLELEHNIFSLKKELNQVMNLLKDKAKGKGIDLFYKTSPAIPDSLIGDQARLKQIIINLTNNAIKYTKEGSVSIEIELLNLKNNIAELKLSIIDTGIGISHEDKEKLFKAFSQIDSSTTRKYGGTGLGLAISKHLSSLMNGNIGVDSVVGKGSTFWFTAHLEVDSVIDTPSETKLTKEPKEQKERLSILLVEDNLLNQKFASATLRKEGYNIDIAENGKIALEKYKNNNYDLILMDIQMPVMDGIEATKKIRAIEDKNNIKDKIKIIAITAYVIEKDRKMCLTAGMDEYLAKPFKPKELIDLIDYVM